MSLFLSNPILGNIKLEKLSKHIDITKYHIRKIFSKSNNPETYTLIAVKGYNQEGELVWELL